MRRLRGQGMDPDRRYWFPVVGYNYRLTNVACAILCAQLERADELLGRRRDVAAWYADELGGTPWLEPQPVAPWAEWVPWLQSVLVAREGAGIDRDGLMRTLEADGIETRPFFVPIHALPPYEPHATAASGVGRSLEVTADLASRGLNLPLHPGLSRGDVARVAGAVRAAVHGST
jgi:perosamine synthetase